ncbi:MAG: hypothetical protein R3F41_10945 [Gammaproteobacteria bacterium]|nr:hypothetical protein [Pseudomonadales bacterium]MCP5348126.1 hypothetical protein [Pseudomonadales bacterium]
MNWEAIGAIGEILGAMAVVMTLVYLAVQVRYAKEAAADNNRIVRASGVREMYMAQVNNPEFRSVLHKAGDSGYLQQIADDLGIIKEEADILDAASGYWFWLHWGQYSSTHSESDLQELKNLIGSFYKTDSVYNCWKKSPWHRPLLDPKFVKFVDEIVERQ